MFEKLVILFLLISSSVATFDVLQLMREFIEEKDINITRVRTPEERDRRWREFAVLDFIGLVEQYEGYKAEEYDVKTSDGYILKLHRISASPFSPKMPGKPVIYIGHGLFGSSDFHVVLGAEQAMPFQLADAGYDVWIGNFRGNTYSRRHIQRSPVGSNYKFWNFSMDELGLIDLPKLIDTVLEKTKQKKLTYIGYSMGTTVSYILLAGKPEYNKKMNLVVSLAPEALFSPPYSSLMDTLLVLMPAAKALVKTARVYQVLPQSKLIQIIGKDICVSEVGQLFCSTFLNAVAHTDQMNRTALPLILAHVPAGSSFNVVDHYYQMIITGKFAKYSSGVLRNQIKYKSIMPPEYDLKKITSPQALFYSTTDVYSTVRDTQKLRNTLENVVAFEQVPDNYNHLDFMWNRNVRNTVYNRMLGIIEKYTK